MTEQLHFHFSLSCIGEGNGNSLQCSCLQNPRDRGAWWAAVYGVPKSRTRLKRLSSSSSRVLNRDITSLTKAHLVKAMVFPVAMYGCESCIIKKAECRRIDAFELLCWRRLESPLDHKKIKSVNPKGDYSWIFIGRSDAEAEAPVLWPPDAKNWLIRKTLIVGKIEGRSRRGRQDEMVGWHHQLDGHEFEQALGAGDGWGSLACCSPWGHK